MRQGCARTASVSLVFDAVGREVWLDAVADGDADPVSGSQAQLLCPGHAEALRVPVGWAVVDRRSPLTPRAGEGAATDEPVIDPGPVERAGQEADSFASGEIVEPHAEDQVEPHAEDQAEDEAAPDVEPEPSAQPAGARRGGSMLDRAFAWAGPQRSVITDRGGPDGPDERSGTDSE
jgi:hypothetical protein